MISILLRTSYNAGDRYAESTIAMAPLDGETVVQLVARAKGFSSGQIDDVIEIRVAHEDRP